MPHISHILARHELPNPIDSQEFGNKASDFTRVLVNGSLSVALVLLGGFFAGLTLALMGQDEITLRVLSTSGLGRQKSDAQRVLSLLHKGKHWVLVTLLLGNVIVNEALPIVLDEEMNGGWIAVIVSTLLVVVFGEIIPQSVCAKYGLAIGASSASLVSILMYVLSPLGYPIARLLDRVLGTYHDRKFSREGLKTLIMLHEAPLYAPTPILPDRLHPLETSSIMTLLSASSIPISSLMTPSRTIFCLSTHTYLDELTRYDVMKSGFSKIPVYEEGFNERFIGFLDTKLLIGTGFQEENARVGQLELGSLRTLAPETSLTEALGVFRNREAKIVVVTEGGKSDGQALGILTFRDMVEEVIGKEMEMR